MRSRSAAAPELATGTRHATRPRSIGLGNVGVGLGDGGGVALEERQRHRYRDVATCSRLARAFAAGVHADRDIGVAVAALDAEPGPGGFFTCRQSALLGQVLHRCEQLLQPVRQRVVDRRAELTGDFRQRGRG